MLDWNTMITCKEIKKKNDHIALHFCFTIKIVCFFTLFIRYLNNSIILQPFIPHPSQFIHQIIPQIRPMNALLILKLKFPLTKIHFKLAPAGIKSWRFNTGIIFTDLFCHFWAVNHSALNWPGILVILLLVLVLALELLETNVYFCWFDTHYVLSNVCLLLKVIKFEL